MPRFRLKIHHGIKWASLSQISRQGVQFVSFVVLAAILGPVDVGSYAMAMVVVGFATMFRDFGVNALIISEPSLSPELFSAAYWVNLGIGSVIALCVFASSFVAGWIYGNSDVGSVIRVLALTCIAGGVSVIHQALLERNFRFKELAIIEIGSALSGAVVALAMAYRGYGVWALVAQQLVTVTVNSFLLMRVSPGELKGPPDLANIRRVLNYGKSITGFSLANFCIRNGDNFLIGRFVGAEALGAYSLAYKLMMVPLQTVSSIVCRISFPELSRLQEHNEALKARYLLLTEQIAVLAFPIMAGLAIYSDFLISTFFGAKWSDTPRLLIILAAAGAVQTTIFPVGQLYLIKGRPGLMFRVTAIMSVITVLAFVAGIPWGALGVAIGYVLVTLLTAPFEIHYPGALIGVRVLDVFATIARPALNTCLAAFFGLLVMRGMSGMPKMLTFAVSFAAFSSVYVLTTFFGPRLGGGTIWNGRNR